MCFWGKGLFDKLGLEMGGGDTISNAEDVRREQSDSLSLSGRTLQMSPKGNICPKSHKEGNPRTPTPWLRHRGFARGTPVRREQIYSLTSFGRTPYLTQKCQVPMLGYNENRPPCIPQPKNIAMQCFSHGMNGVAKRREGLE